MRDGGGKGGVPHTSQNLWGVDHSGARMPGVLWSGDMREHEHCPLCVCVCVCVRVRACMRVSCK